MATKSKALDKNEWRELRNTIYTFFYYSNKPIGNTELGLQFKNQKKSDVENILNDLVEKKKIVSKAFSKSKIYYLAQDMEYTVDDSEYTDEIDETQDQTEDNKVMRYLRWKNKLLSMNLKTLQEECNEVEGSLALLNEEMTTSELVKAIESLESEISKFDSSVGEEIVEPETFEKLKKGLVTIQKMSTERSKLFKGMVAGISEGLEVKKQDLLEEAGIGE
ncbi:26S proteasome regulatory subunit, ATPase 3, interacting protein [Pancytospora epiphaga]|nr:26S proteasome regulatory subunit, ATPase 3, interacting protein [Pancytospora epiphaga]